MRSYEFSAFLLAFATMTTPNAAMGQPSEAPAADALDHRAADIAAVFRGERDTADVFAPEFIAAVPPTQLRALGTQLIAMHGPLEGATISGRETDYVATLVLHFARAKVSGPLQLSRTAPHQVSGLLIRSVEPIGDNAERIAADLALLPGMATAYYAPLDASQPPVFAHNAQRPMALGSTFKLYLLSALAHEIAAGRRLWDEVARLDRRSYPSGAMLDWPRGAPVTLHTLATAMISVSDNTATDQLIAVLGREVVEREIRASHANPAQMLPLLTTLEFFALKGDPPLAQRFAQGDEAQQAQLIAELAGRLRGDPDNGPPVTLDRPTAIETVEWFATPADLRALLARLAALPDPTARSIMAVNPSVLSGKKAEFPYIGYKGGSEPGVLNLTWLVQTPSGEWRILTLGWSNPVDEVDTAQLTAMAQRILALGAPGN